MDAKKTLGIMRPCFGKTPGQDLLFINDGKARAYDTTHSICMPFPSGDRFAVKAVDFAKIVDKADPAKLKIEVTDTHVIVKSGRSRTKLPRIADDDAFVPEPESDQWRNFSPAITQAMGKIFKFMVVGDDDERRNLLSMTLHVTDGYVYATNGVIAARAAFEDDITVPDLNLPSWSFGMMNKLNVKAWQFTENYAAFLTDDGGWYRAQLINIDFPLAVMKGIIDEIQPNTIGPAINVSNDFIAAFKEATTLSPRYLEISPQGFNGLAGDTETMIDFPLPVQATTKWNPDFIQKMIDAQAVSFFPEPTGQNDRGFFIGPGLEGIIMRIRV